MVSSKECIVIGLGDGSDRFSRVQLFSADEGYLSILKRKSTRRSGTTHLDLFQTVEAVLEQKNDGNAMFLKECSIQTERPSIGKRFQAFEAASRFCRAVYLNARHMQNPEVVYTLLTQSLDAWNTKKLPQTTFLKALFRLAAEDGFPVRESWLRQLPAKTSESLQVLLFTPLDERNTDETFAKELAEDLTTWLIHQQDFLF